MILSTPTHGIVNTPHDETTCLALNIYFEARSEPIDSQMAVAFVTLNRVESARYPDTICKVVKQKRGRTCQFSWYCDGKSDRPRNYNAWRKAYGVAEIILELVHYSIIDFTGGATHYHADYVNPRWSGGLAFTRKIGSHLFYKR
jgi:spore germination cell wall hydrolase CwlJ-like protein